MKPFFRRLVVLCVSATLIIFAFRQLRPRNELPSPSFTSSLTIKSAFKWSEVPLRFPISTITPLPSGKPASIPKIQHAFGAETTHSKDQRTYRQAAVKEAFIHTWEGYKRHAWLQDEVTPVSRGYKNPYGQRGASLVDALDTLIIMGLDSEFEAAVKAMKQIDFTTAAIYRLNVFETTIRFLGGLLSAYDLSHRKHHSLLYQATDLGEMLYKAFDTPNRMPIARWDWEKCVYTSDTISQTDEG
jgi:mannosyl-oligosaccharide alpha-1,2-mannosidase